MRPSSREMLQSIEYSFETYVEPELEHPLATSAAAGIKNLLRHLSVRIEAEPELLYRDNHEKKSLCVELAAVLEAAQGTITNSTIVSLIKALNAASEKQYRKAEQFPTLALLADENVSLKAVVDEVIKVLHANRAAIPTTVYEQTSRLVHDQLSRQMERETACFDNTYTGPMF